MVFDETVSKIKSAFGGQPPQEQRRYQPSSQKRGAGGDISRFRTESQRGRLLRAAQPTLDQIRAQNQAEAEEQANRPSTSKRVLQAGLKVGSFLAEPLLYGLKDEANFIRGKGEKNGFAPPHKQHIPQGNSPNLPSHKVIPNELRSQVREMNKQKVRFSVISSRTDLSRKEIRQIIGRKQTRQKGFSDYLFGR